MLNAELLDTAALIGTALGFSGLMHAYIRHRTLRRLERARAARDGQAAAGRPRGTAGRQAVG